MRFNVGYIRCTGDVGYIRCTVDVGYIRYVGERAHTLNLLYARYARYINILNMWDIQVLNLTTWNGNRKSLVNHIQAGYIKVGTARSTGV